MFWKIVFVLSILGIILGFIILAVSLSMMNSAPSRDTDAREMAVVGIIIGALMMLIAFLAAFVSLLFILRASKKDFDAKNPKPGE